MRKGFDSLTAISFFSGLVILLFITLPLLRMMTAPGLDSLLEACRDREVQRAITLSLGGAAAAALLAVIFGTPFAWLLARREFFGKRLIEALVDLPIVIPHPVVGIAILGVVGREHPFGALLLEAGIRVMGSVSGIIIVMTFVGLPFYLNAARESFAAVSPRLEAVSRSLGAGPWATFARVTLPLAGRGLAAGVVMASARAISEFGAVVVVAYHPMIAPVLIYERFEAYGLKYSQPVAVLLVGICLLLFLLLRILSGRAPSGSGLGRGLKR